MADNKEPWWKAWLGARFLNPDDTARDLKLLAFGAGNVCAIVWLSYDLHRSASMTTQWVDAFMWYLASVSVGGSLWTAVDAWKTHKKQSEDGGGQ